MEAGSILCTGHSWRPQPAAVSKFKGLQADLLSSAFQWAEVGWCKQPLQRTSSESCKPGGCKGWVLGKGLRLPVVQMLMSLFPPSRRSIQEQWVLATSKTRMILCAPQRALNKARVEIVHKHKKRDGASLESRTHSLFYYCCPRPGPGDLKDTVGGVMAKDRMWARHSLAF